MNAPVRQDRDQAVRDARLFVATAMARGDEPCDVFHSLGNEFAPATATWEEALAATIMCARHIGLGEAVGR